MFKFNAYPEPATMLRTLALTLAVAIMMASGFGFAPADQIAVDGVAEQVPVSDLKSSRLDITHS